MGIVVYNVISPYYSAVILLHELRARSNGVRRVCCPVSFMTVSEKGAKTENVKEKSLQTI